jgi:hypothetical protein
MFISSGFVVVWLWITYAPYTHYPQNKIVAVLVALSLYNFRTQTINKLEVYMHKINHYLSQGCIILNLSTESTRPTRANLNKLKGLIV